MARKAVVEYVGDADSLIRATQNAQRANEKLAGSLTRAVKTMERSHKTLGATASQSQSQVRRSMGGTVAGMAKMVAASTGLVGVGAAIAKVGTATVGFDKSMRNVNSIAQLSETSLGHLQKQVLNLAGKTAQAPVTLANGLYDLVSSGFNAKQSMTILAASAKAATAGLTTTEVSTGAVAAVLNAYHLPASKAAQVSDTLFQTVNRGVVSFSDLSTTIGDVLPFAASLHVGLNQVGAAVSTMTKEGIPAPETMTRIKTVMEAFIKPSVGMSKAIKATGASSGEALVKQKGFQGAIEALIKTTDGSKNSVAKLFPNIRALGGALALTGTNAKTAHTDIRAFKDVTGATDKALSQQSKSISFQWNKISAVFSSLAIQAGSVLIPAVGSAIRAVASFVEQMKAGTGTAGEIRTKVVAAFEDVKRVTLTVVGGITDLVNGFKQGKTWAVAAVAAIAGLSAAALAIKAVMVATKAWTGAQIALDVALNANPIGLVIVAVAALSAAFIIAYKKSTAFRTAVDTNFAAVKKIVKEVADFIGPALGVAFNYAKAVVKRVIPGIRQAIEGIVSIVRGVVNVVSGILHGNFAQVWRGIKGIVGGALKLALGVVRAFTAPLRDAMARLGGAAVQVLHDLGSRFVELGKNLIQGMVNGITSKAKDVADAATNVAKGAVHGVKHFLGISSPSRVFGEIGQQTGEGFALGLASTAGRVMAGAKAGLLFPLDAAISALEGKKEALQKKFDAIDARAQRSTLLADVRAARREKSSGGSSSGGASSVSLAGLKSSGGNSVARTALAVATRMGATAKQKLALIEAGIVESGLRNLNYGDRDSVGFLQQRPSAGWHGLMNVPKAAAEFLAHARGKNSKNLTAGQLAQSVQVSAFPARYDAVAGQARAIIASLGGGGGGSKGSHSVSVGGSGGSSVKDALKALHEFDANALRAQKLARIDMRIKGLEQLKAFNGAIAGVAAQIKDKLGAAVDQFRAKWEATTGKDIDAANQKTLDGFDAETEAAIANGDVAKKLAAAKASDDKIAADAEDAANKKALDDAKKSGDPQAIADAQAAIDKTAREREITRLEAAAEDERAGIQADRATKRKALEDQQAADRQKAQDDATAAFSAALSTQLNAEVAQLNARKENYAQFVKDVSKILTPLGLTFDTSPDEEATVNGGPGTAGAPQGKPPAKKKPAKKKPKSKKAGGGWVYPGTDYWVGEVGPERFTPSTPGRITPASTSAASGGKLIENVNIYGSRGLSEDRIARKLAFLLR